jgi:hypothetical protein
MKIRLSWRRKPHGYRISSRILQTRTECNLSKLTAYSWRRLPYNQIVLVSARKCCNVSGTSGTLAVMLDCFYSPLIEVVQGTPRIPLRTGPSRGHQVTSTQHTRGDSAASGAGQIADRQIEQSKTSKVIPTYNNHRRADMRRSSLKRKTSCLKNNMQKILQRDFLWYVSSKLTCLLVPIINLC